MDVEMYTMCCWTGENDRPPQLFSVSSSSPEAAKERISSLSASIFNMEEEKVASYGIVAGTFTSLAEFADAAGKRDELAAWL